MRKVFFATLMVFMMSAATALAANWQQIYLDDTDNKIFFDTDSVQVSEMTSTRDDVIFDAMFRMDYSDKGRTALIDWYRDYSIMPRGIENLSYSLSKMQFKREGDKRYYRILERISYTASGAQLTDMHYNGANDNWQEIPVASVIDVEYFEANLIVEGKLYKRIDSSGI